MTDFTVCDEHPCLDFFDNTAEIPEDLQNFDIDEFLGLQSAITGSEIDVDVLLPKRLYAKIPSVTNTQELSPNSDDSGFFSPNQTKNDHFQLQNEPASEYLQLTAYDPSIEGNNWPANQAPLITYAVISENRPQLIEPITIGPVSEIDDATANQMAVNENDENENESEMEDDEDSEDILSDKILFSGSKTRTLPTSYTTQSSNGQTRVNSLTDEEKELLAHEGVRIPENMPLTKMEEKVLKKVRRKIRNRHSAHASRQKKKDYIRNLELRVKKCTDVNTQLQIQIEKLENQNTSLVKQLSHLRSIITQKVASGTKNGKTLNATTGTCLMMVVFSCCFLMFPKSQFNTSEVNANIPYDKMASVVSRTILAAEDPVSDLNNSNDSRNRKQFFTDLGNHVDADWFDVTKTPANPDQDVANIVRTSYDDLIAMESAENAQTVNSSVLRKVAVPLTVKKDL